MRRRNISLRRLMWKEDIGKDKIMNSELKVRLIFMDLNMPIMDGI